MQTNKKVSLSEYCKLGYTKKSRDTLIRMLRNGLLPEKVVRAEKINTTYILYLKIENNGK